MKQRFVVEIDWEDEEAVDAAWFERIVYDGLEDNGIFKSECGIKGEWKTLEVLLEEEIPKVLRFAKLWKPIGDNYESK